ncbi:hypothetical protein [Rodentibacter haemolyticus]|uniref:Phage protein n=1 Tax=Rodentibacter haemolyticus TaxID=2778911 RepID=A0ABX6UVS1_9PAST|nr:hypothetical protein [Rodentibacter haemolyticus]QPB42182.1 hypothetical protein IHV77_09735 [Rodentibacter haemolyticus]
MTAHIHAKLMAEYAKDAMETDKPWKRWEVKNDSDVKWYACKNHPAWHEDRQYRRKPKTILINGIEVPEPVREPLHKGDTYYTPDFDKNMYSALGWCDDDYDIEYLRNGIIHLTKENAIAHAKALISFTEVKDE